MTKNEERITGLDLVLKYGVSRNEALDLISRFRPYWRYRGTLASIETLNSVKSQILDAYLNLYGALEKLVAGLMSSEEEHSCENVFAKFLPADIPSSFFEATLQIHCPLIDFYNRDYTGSPQEFFNAILKLPRRPNDMCQFSGYWLYAGIKSPFELYSDFTLGQSTVDEYQARQLWENIKDPKAQDKPLLDLLLFKIFADISFDRKEMTIKFPALAELTVDAAPARAAVKKTKSSNNLKTSGVTQKEAAAMFGVSEREIQKWEAGIRTPHGWPGRANTMSLKAFAFSYASQKALKKGAVALNRAELTQDGNMDAFSSDQNNAWR